MHVSRIVVIGKFIRVIFTVTVTTNAVLALASFKYQFLKWDTHLNVAQYYYLRKWSHPQMVARLEVNFPGLY